MMKYIQYIVVSLVLFTSCNYLDVEPVGKVIPDEISEFRALLTTAYGTYPQYKRLLTVRSDEVFPDAYGLSYEDHIDLATWNDENPDPITPTYPWTDAYKTIFYANSVIEGVMDAKEDVKTDTREQLLAEAYCLRAYVHFDLLNLYAKWYTPETATSDRGIPLYLTIDIGQEFVPSSVENVYKQIVSDIEEAGKYMQVEEQPAATRYRFSKKSLKAFEARVRLYRGEWELAQKAAEDILPQCPLEDIVTGTVKPWTSESKEAILSMEQVSSTVIREDMYVLDNVLSKYNMDKEGEVYKDARIGLYLRPGYAAAYAGKGGTQGEKVSFRSSEIYLIAAEAAARQDGKLSIAKSYLLTLLKNRLQNSYYNEKATEIEAMNQQQLIDEIMNERARELIFEGHRWFDLRRTTRPEIVKVYFDANFDMHTATFQQDDPKYIIPYPEEAIQNNPNLGGR